MQTDQIMMFVHTVPIFHALEPAQLEQLANAATVREFASGDLLLRRGAEENELFIVVAGELQAFLGEEQVGFERELTRFYPGDYFGIIGVLAGDRSAVSVRAVASGRALVLSRQNIDHLFQTSREFGPALCRSLASNLKQGIGDITAIPFVRLESFPNIESTVGLLSPRISKFCQAMVVRRDSDWVQVAMVNPNDERARNFIKDVLHEFQVELVAVAEDDFQRHAARLLGTADRTASAERFENLAHVDSTGQRVPIAETSAQDLLPRILSAAIQSGASDIHIEPVGDAGLVRFRLDGKLMPIEDHIAPPVLRQIISRLKVMAELDITNVRRPQDGRFLVLADERRIEFRMSAMPCQGGEKIVLRLVAPDAYLGNLSNLFVSEPVALFAKDVFRQPDGLVLVTGPTGCGKTTSLYAAMNLLNAEAPTSNFVTIEDPVEYNLKYATQIQVDHELGLDFKDILRSVLRQDPDTILVGEIRDQESAAIAVEAATTGHLVLSSLHTHSALETLVRLRNLQVRPYMLATALRGVISQKLVPRLCPGYTQQVNPDDPVVGRLKRLGVLEENGHEALQRGVEVEGGPQDGESGRVALYEILSITDQLRDLIDRSANQSEIEGALNDECFFSFARYSRLLLAGGYVAPERIERVFPKQPSAIAS